jgi:hypothetical protein
MKPYSISLVNAIVLILMGTWGYIDSDIHSKTALIPVISGLVLLILTPWFKNGNRVVAHIAVILTLVILIALYKPLTGSIGRHNSFATFRVSIMIISSLLAMVVFIKSFIDARIKPK